MKNILSNIIFLLVYVTIYWLLSKYCTNFETLFGPNFTTLMLSIFSIYIIIAFIYDFFCCGKYDVIGQRKIRLISLLIFIIVILSSTYLYEISSDTFIDKYDVLVIDAVSSSYYKDNEDLSEGFSLSLKDYPNLAFEIPEEHLTDKSAKQTLSILSKTLLIKIAINKKEFYNALTITPSQNRKIKTYGIYSRSDKLNSDTLAKEFNEETQLAVVKSSLFFVSMAMIVLLQSIFIHLFRLIKLFFYFKR